MPQPIVRIAILSLLSLFLFGCTITRKITPVESGPTVGTIYLQKNTSVHMEGLHPEVAKQLTELGFVVTTFEGQPPAEAKYWMSYTANWAWDMAMYLTYFQATLLDEGRVIGRAEYDARRGGGNMGKFGKTSEKIRPLLMDLFTNVKRSKQEPAAVKSD